MKCALARSLTRATIDLTISVPVHTSVKLRAVNDGDIMVTGLDGGAGPSMISMAL